MIHNYRTADDHHVILLCLFISINVHTLYLVAKTWIFSLFSCKRYAFNFQPFKRFWNCYPIFDRMWSKYMIASYSLFYTRNNDVKTCMKSKSCSNSCSSGSGYFIDLGFTLTMLFLLQKPGQPSHWLQATADCFPHYCSKIMTLIFDIFSSAAILIVIDQNISGWVRCSLVITWNCENEKSWL